VVTEVQLDAAGEAEKRYECFYSKGENLVKVKVDPELCVACGLCAETVPEVFEMEDDKAVVTVDVIPAELEAKVRQAAEDCPVEAIEIE
jgi:ferredoxin